MRSVRLRNTLSRIRKAIPLIIAIKRIKYLGINLTKEVKYLYTKICKTFNFSIEKDTNEIIYI